MTKSIKSPLHRTAVVSTLLLSTLCVTSFAQEKAPVSDERISIESDDQILIEASIDLDFSGGNVAMFRATLNRELPDLNILVKGDPYSRSVLIPPMTMKNVDCQQIATCLEEVADIGCIFPSSNIMVLKLEMNDDVPPLDRLFDINFKGGSLADLKAVLEETLPDLNIIEGYSEDDMSSVQVPAVNLKGVNCHQLVELLHEIADDHLNFYFMEAETNILMLSGKVYRKPVSQPEPAPKPQLELLAYPMDNLLGSYSMEDIILALDQAYMVMDLDIPEYRVHKETSMLMVAVTPKQLEIANKILASLESAVEKASEN